MIYLNPNSYFSDVTCILDLKTRLGARDEMSFHTDGTLQARRGAVAWITSGHHARRDGRQGF